MTLQEAKNKVANSKGYANWQYLESSLEKALVVRLSDEAAELYASSITENSGTVYIDALQGAIEEKTGDSKVVKAAKKILAEVLEGLTPEPTTEEAPVEETTTEEETPASDEEAAADEPTN